jgi:hypothetical protein
MSRKRADRSLRLRRRVGRATFIAPANGLTALAGRYGAAAMESSDGTEADVANPAISVRRGPSSPAQPWRPGRLARICAGVDNKVAHRRRGTAFHLTTPPSVGRPVGLVAPRLPVGSSPSDEGDDHVRGVAVEVLAASVVDRGRPRVGVPGGDLHISEWDAASRAAMMNAALSM